MVFVLPKFTQVLCRYANRAFYAALRVPGKKQLLKTQFIQPSLGEDEWRLHYVYFLQGTEQIVQGDQFWRIPLRLTYPPWSGESRKTHSFLLLHHLESTDKYETEMLPLVFFHWKLQNYFWKCLLLLFPITVIALCASF